MKFKNNVPQNLATEIGRTTPFDSLEQEIFLNLIRTSEYITSNLNKLFIKYGITQPQYNVLKILQVEKDNRAPIKKVGKRLVTRGPDVTRLVDRLEKAKLVERHRCPADRRVVYVQMTEAGRAILDQLGPPIKKVHAQRMGHLNPKKLMILNQLLFELRQPGKADKLS